MDTVALLAQHPDLLEEFNAWDDRVLVEIERMGFTADEARAIITGSLEQFSKRIIIQNDGPGFVENAKQCRSIVYAIAWLLLTGGGTLMPFESPLRPCGTGHWLERRDLSALEADVQRRFEIPPELFRKNMKHSAAVRILAGFAMSIAGAAVDAAPCCMGHAQELVTMPVRTRAAGAACLLSWMMFQEMGDEIGRQVAARLPRPGQN